MTPHYPPCRQVQLVCRRWRRVWFSEHRIWDSLHIRRSGDPTPLMAIVQRVAPLVQQLAVKGTGDRQPLGQEQSGQWSLPALLACFPAGRRQRLQALRLWAEHHRVPPGPYVFWTLHSAEPLSAAAMRQVGRLRGLRALELDSWQLPHCTAHVLGKLTQLSQLRLRARQLPEGCLPGVVTEQMTQLRSLVLETSLACSPVGISQLTALSALTRLVSLQDCFLQ